MPSLLSRLQSDAVANHPNLWFQTSVNYHKLKNGKSITATSTTESAVTAAPIEGGEADGVLMTEA
jgi:hypothetical protein